MVLKSTKDGVHYKVQNLLVREDAQERSFCDNRSMPTFFLQKFWWFLAGIMHGCPRFHFKVLFFPRIIISYNLMSIIIIVPFYPTAASSQVGLGEVFELTWGGPTKTLPG